MHIRYFIYSQITIQVYVSIEKKVIDNLLLSVRCVYEQEEVKNIYAYRLNTTIN